MKDNRLGLFMISTPSPCLQITESHRFVLVIHFKALVHIGAISYSETLLQTLYRHEQHHKSPDSDVRENEKHMLPRGHPFEVEIRGASIHVVELLVQAIRTKLDSEPQDQIVNAIVVDFYLWDLAKESQETMGDIPIHLTRSIYY